MPRLDGKSIAEIFADRYGLPLTYEAGQDSDGYPYVTLAPSEIHKNDGFEVTITLGWRSLTIQFLPGPYALSMVQGMESATSEDKAAFASLVSRLIELGGRIQMLVNDSPVDPISPQNWPRDWRRLVLSVAKSPLAVDTENDSEIQGAVLDWGGKFIAAVVALLPLEERHVSEPEGPEYLPEGARARIEVNRYERSQVNRTACIELHGCACTACGLDFEDSYGEIGRGFIHVHHATPVSQMGESYVVNPLTDLIPLCPNCHAMVHRKDPPYTIEQLREIIESASN